MFRDLGKEKRTRFRKKKKKRKKEKYTKKENKTHRCQKWVDMNEKVLKK